MTNRKIAAAVLALALTLGLCGCDENMAANNPGLTVPTVDPHAGMVEVADGFGGTRWVKLYEDVAVNAFDSGMFYTDERGRAGYAGADYNTLTGVDVSFYQGDIDWAAVAADGVDFAIIRVGYRGWTEGVLYEDERFAEYIQGAREAGLRLGVYFFSQAITAEEATEEARFVLERIASVDITMPVVFDWEGAGVGEEARTHLLDSETLTACAAAFCETVSAAGYTPAVYFYRSLGYDEYVLNELDEYMFWFSGAESAPSFYYEFGMWQYSFTGAVSGVAADVDLNLYFEKTPAQE